MTRTICDICGAESGMLFNLTPTYETQHSERYRLTDEKALDFTRKDICSTCIREMLAYMERSIP